MPFILWPGDTTAVQVLGGKAAALAALQDTGVPIPGWFAVTPDAFEASLTPEQRAALVEACRGADDTAIEAALAALTPAAAVRAAVAPALAALCPRAAAVAVRSSAVDEDGIHRSFAGQLDTFLDVAPEHVSERMVGVWRSAFGARVLAYRQTLGISSLPPAPAILVQRMVRPDWAGVAFSADPTTGRRGVAVVSAVHGLGDKLVEGASDAVTYRVDRQGRVARAPEPPTGAADARGATLGTSDAPQALPSDAPLHLDDEEVAAVAAMARACERRFGRPQDIEWAMEDSRLYLLQSRPITTLHDLADPDGNLQVWDNSNIAESYGGVTTPLTFSFARHVYEEVYRQLCRALGAPASLVEEHADTFRHMLGLVRGRVYYNLFSWYRLLALLPGFTVNRRFMEQMMGVKEGLPESLVVELAAASWRARLTDSRRLVTALFSLTVSLCTLPRRIRRFHTRLDVALGGSSPNLAEMRADELVAHYRELERRLITHWDAPLLNDLFAMVFYGLLGTLTVKWCGDATRSLQNDLLSGEGGIISAEPATRVRALARLAAGDTPFVAALTAGSLEEIVRCTREHPAFAAAYEAYLDKFADRCLEELKLESPTLCDDPLPLLRAVGQLAGRLGPVAAGPDDAAAPGMDARMRAERRLAHALRAHPLRRAIAGIVLDQARRRVRDRENLRFERTRVFGRVRRVFLELGQRFHALDLLDAPRDVFYLEVDEVLGYVEGTATTTDLKGLVALRGAEYARHRAAEPPADRFVTHGMVYQGNAFRGSVSAPPARGERLQGVGCCPGVVRGRARIIVNPKDAQLRHGDILVAERTDPGWIMLFPAAAGVAVERGSLLSHSAIVARELGIPTIVAAKGVTQWLADGDWVELDGSAGTLTRLAPAAVEATAASEEESYVTG